MHAGLDPIGRDRTGCMLLVAHITTSAPCTASRALATGDDLDAETLRHLAAQTSAGARDRGCKHRMRSIGRTAAIADACPPACQPVPSSAGNARIRPRQMFRRKPAGRRDAHALHDAVGIDGQRLAGRDAEQQHQSDIALVRARTGF